ncbi:MAG TPA: hypothetical protein DER10_06520 [Elusimicrobia bacterium]|nr:MAG: hypothetical protein A2X33_06995 [Elusimicrobia bacterium GWA2_51_34]HAF95474.1 hypothetical protein [Elusimicrobiota bacterium]HCE98136.1 hypothetical protein [Elusimicrobiota bacterium]
MTQMVRDKARNAESSKGNRRFLKYLFCLFAALLFLLSSAARAETIVAQVTVVSTNSISLSWTLSNPAVEQPLMAISTDSSFAANISTFSTGELGEQTTSYYGLSGNTTYYFKVKVSTESDDNYSDSVSTLTLPARPTPALFYEVNITSVTAQWTANTNSDGTVYIAETAVNEGLNESLSLSSTATTAVFEGLNADTTYYFGINAEGFTGLISGYSDITSTITLAGPPSDETYALVSSTGMSIFWNPGLNPDWTRYELIISTDNFGTVFDSTITPGNYYEAGGLKPNTIHYFKAAAVNGAGIKSDYYIFGSTLTRAAVPDTPSLGVPTVNSVQAWWQYNENPAGTEYFVQVSTAPDFTGADSGPGEWFAALTRNITPLESGVQYYFQVKARDMWGRESDYLYLGSETTSTGADITPPSVVDLQGGDNNWRGSASGYYMVHFTDLGSGLSYFQVKVTTGPDFSGTQVADWSNVVTNINADTYNTDWQLPADIFNSIQENVTSYVSVRAYDKADPQPNVSVSTDVFYVIRDTTLPNIENHAVSPSGWLISDPGVFNVDFNDALSGLVQVLYSASDQANTANANVLGWTAINSFVSSASYAADWGINFAALKDGASNYISARAVDAAGNTRTLNDVFRILKNTVGPAVTITSPAGGYVSALTAITGISTARNEDSAVASNEIALRELTSSSSFYYDGISFSSDTIVWFAASGLSDWSYNSSTVPFAAGVVYAALARSKDVSSLVTPMPYPNAIFQFDWIQPSVSLSTPLASSSVYEFNEASGAASDSGGAGLSSVEVYIQRLSDSKWWNFSSSLWGTVPVSSAVSGGASWSFTPGSALKGGLAHNQQYFVTALAKDLSIPANASVFGAVGSTFTLLDIIPPMAVTGLTALTGTSPGKIDLSWVTPGDDIGPLAMPYATFAVQYSTFAEAVFSTQSAQVSISTGVVLPGSMRYYTVGGLVRDTTYYLTLWVSDDAGLWSGSSPVATTMSGEGLDDSISGSVKTPVGLGVTGVLVEAINNVGVPVSTNYTLDDGGGTFNLAGIADAVYRVQATWVENGFSSSVSKDQIPMGYADVNFELSIDYLLASVSGVIPVSSQAAGLKTKALGGGGKTLGTEENNVTLYQGGRRVASARADAAGRFTIRNLIPGQYTLRILSESGEWKEFQLKLESGQTLEVSPLGTLLKKDMVYVYPNPSAARVKFHVATDIKPVEKHLSVFSLDGSLVKEAGNDDGNWIPSSGDKVYDYLWIFSSGKPASGVYFYTLKLKNLLTGETAKKVGKFAVVR